MTYQELHEFTAKVRQDLLAERNSAGHWDGYLSDSALATSVAIAALLHARKHKLAPSNVDQLIKSGLAWLHTHRNQDGGWGDCPESPSNISTVTLTYATLRFAQSEGFLTNEFESSLLASESWLQNDIGSLHPENLVSTLYDRYGKDRTFAVPILTHCALAGILGEGEEAWTLVKSLPFEFSTLPHAFYKSVKMDVVSYALPALIAIGYARHHHFPVQNFILRGLRNLTAGKALRLLKQIQPSSGGYLEATPLTAFVTQSLIASNQGKHPVVPLALDFLVNQARPHGSWPIDANLRTWVSTLSINALTSGAWQFPKDETKVFSDWLIEQQWTGVHPYTQAAPGGFAWTDLPGGVPDADDTPGALLALKNLRHPPTSGIESALKWLLQLQNKDGGIPTFCRGWGKLPFDQSSPDLTIHALRAWNAWLEDFPCLKPEINTAQQRALKFLAKTQHPDGYWIPLWFGNQHTPNQSNPTFGTSRVLSGLSELPYDSTHLQLPALAWLINAQNSDGSWGGDRRTVGSIEETSLALHALLCNMPAEHQEAINRALQFLKHFIDQNGYLAAPIGLYFAKLWYHEKLYPYTFLLSALEKATLVLRP
jgi:squalene-hopene/tetraprenyl-beta-curcumene cyclase